MEDFEKYLKVVNEEDATESKKANKIAEVTILGSFLALAGIGFGLYELGQYTDKQVNIHYEIDQDGNYKIEEKVTYKKLAKYSIIEVKNLNNENKLLIANIYKTGDGGGYFKEIFTGQDYEFVSEDSSSKLQLIKKMPIEDYLLTYNEVKAEYTEDDLKRILNKIEADYEFETKKTKVKGE